MILKLRHWPDPVLQSKCEDVEDFSIVRKYKEEMIEIMEQNKGMGLAANQVGLLYRFFIMKYNSSIIEFINPEITYYSEDKTKDTEGCLSFPGLREKIKRSNIVGVSYMSLEKIVLQGTYDGVCSRCIQHEIDHLDGLTWLDRMSPNKQKKVIKKYGT